MTSATVPPAPPDLLLLRLRAAVAGLLVALIALGLAWELWLAPTGGRTWALKVLPLTVALPGVLRFRLFTHRWLALLVWLYAGEGALRGMTESGVSSTLGWLQLALSLALFAAVAAHVRHRLRKAA